MSDVFRSPEFAPERVQELWNELRGRVRSGVGGDGADDVVQEAFLSALEHPPRDTRSMGAWLTVVARNLWIRTRRRDRNRADREREAGQLWASRRVASIHTSLETHAVVQALDRLAEPYRTALRLRYLEGLGIDEIAERASCPPSTVRSQIKRGLDRLRRMLAAEDPRRLPALGAGFLRGFWRRGSKLPRGLGFSIATCAASVLVLLVFLRQGLVPSRGAASVAATDPASLALQVPAPERLPSRQAVEPWSPPDLASGEPDEEWTFALEGRVLDPAGRPVSGVPVLAARRGETVGRVVARSDVEGRYRIVRIDGRDWVWADDGTRAPSNRHMVASVDPGHGLTLALGLEPTTRLVLTDAQGRPLPGAEVTWFGDSRFGRGAQIDPQGTLEFAPPPRGMRTLADGSFRVGLSDSRSQLLVLAEGEAPFLCKIGLAEVPPSFELRLPRPATLVGTLLDPEGLPVPRATVRLALAYPLPTLEVRTDGNGGFCFERVPPGPNELTLGGEPRADLASLNVAGLMGEGERREQRYSLTPTCTVRGQVTIQGRPAAHQLVQLERLNVTSIHDARTRRTDAQGRYAFPSCSPDSAHAVRVLDADGRVADSARIQDADEEVPELHADTGPERARLSGRVRSRDSDEAPVFAEIWNPQVGNQWLTRVDPETGEFAFQDVLPCAYSLRIWTRGNGAREPEVLRSLRPREDRRLEDLVLERSGTLRVRCEPEDPGARIGVAVWVPSIDGVTPRTKMFLSREPGSDAFQARLPPGEYEYWVFLQGGILERRTAVVESGRTVLDVVDVCPTLAVSFDLRAPRPFRSNEQFDLRVQAGRIHRLHLANTQLPNAFRGLLPAGASRIDVTSNAGLRGTWTAGDTPVHEGDVLQIELQEPGGS